MIRFEIQELLNQSDWGVTYLAYDKQDQCDIALRRYMPLGRDGTLNEQQIREYDQRCIRLSRIEHPNLRTVVQGSVDRIDSTPYLATEWVEGKPLDELLEGEKLDAPTAMDLAKCALKVSLALSNTFGEEAIWIDTDPNSIIVGSEASNRGFTFWICLSRWFGMQPGERSVASVATMIEKLVGWDTQVYSKESGGGLGGWVKQVKGSPDIGVQEALDVLEEISGGKSKRSSQKRTKKWLVTPPPSPKRAKPRRNLSPAPAPAAAAPKTLSSQASPFLIPPRGVKPSQPVQSPGGAQMHLPPRPITPTQQLPAPTAPSAPVVNSSSGSSVPMIVAIACIACLVGIAYLVKRNQDRMLEQLANNAAVEAPEDENVGKAEEGANKGRTGEAKANRSTKPSSPGSATPKPSSDPKPNSSTPSSDARMFTPDEKPEFNKTPHGTPVKLRGVVRRIHVDAQRTILIFDNGRDPLIRAYTWKGKFEGNRKRETFEPFRGREIIVEGHVNDGRNVAPKHVLFTRLDQISLVDEEPAKGADSADPADPETAVDYDDLPLTFPNQLNKLQDLGSGNPAKLSGTLNEVSQNGEVVVLQFSHAPENKTYLYGRADASQFEGELSAEMFRKYIGRRIVIEGIFILNPDLGVDSHYVEFVRPSQVKLRGQ